MIVKYKSFEEMVFNIETYHGHKLSPDQLDYIRSVAGTETDVKLWTKESRDSSCCDLPFFQRTDGKGPWGGSLVCGHMCDID